MYLSPKDLVSTHANFQLLTVAYIKTCLWMLVDRSTYFHWWLVLFSVWSDSIDDGGWTLVRRVKKGTTWHPATDSLAGTDEYGTLGHETSDESFSIRFDKTRFNQFLFATGIWYCCLYLLYLVTVTNFSMQKFQNPFPFAFHKRFN